MDCNDYGIGTEWAWYRSPKAFSANVVRWSVAKLQLKLRILFGPNASICGQIHGLQNSEITSENRADGKHLHRDILRV